MIESLLTFLDSTYFQNLLFNLLRAGIFLTAASIGIHAAAKYIRSAFSRKFESEAVLDLIKDLATFFLWFWAALIALSLLGFTGIASSLGTATGFLALGVAYALKDVIADTVAGIYLAQDRDFNPGDTVEVDSYTGEITEVGLRKTRLKLENGNTRVLNNSDAEKKWTKIS